MNSKGVRLALSGNNSWQAANPHVPDRNIIAIE